MMTALIVYFSMCGLVLIGYMIGVYNERHYGPAAAQLELDKEMAEYYASRGNALYDPSIEDALAQLDLDNEVLSRTILKHGHLRRVK